MELSFFTKSYTYFAVLESALLRLTRTLHSSHYTLQPFLSSPLFQQPCLALYQQLSIFRSRRAARPSDVHITRAEFDCDRVWQTTPTTSYIAVSVHYAGLSTPIDHFLCSSRITDTRGHPRVQADPSNAALAIHQTPLGFFSGLCWLTYRLFTPVLRVSTAQTIRKILANGKRLRTMAHRFFFFRGRWLAFKC